MHLRVTGQVRSELDGIFDYWAEHASPETASRMISAIAEHFALLAEAPNIGRACDEIAPGILSFPVGKYLIYYRKTRGILQILHVFHGAQDQARAFTPSKRP
jgi:toxin ParE1/3/4